VFLDEPMSGLDPIGRREIRSLILSLRDRGCTLFFSSHILADAEALCSRVAILANGRLVADGALADLLAFEVRGWELVVSGLRAETLDRLSSDGVVRRATRIADGRYALELALSPPPEQVLQNLVATGARLVALNPVRETLEDFFMRRVAEAESRERAGA